MSTKSYTKTIAYGTSADVREAINNAELTKQIKYSQSSLGLGTMVVDLSDIKSALSSYLNVCITSIKVSYDVYLVSDGLGGVQTVAGSWVLQAGTVSGSVSGTTFNQSSFSNVGSSWEFKMSNKSESGFETVSSWTNKSNTLFSGSKALSDFPYLGLSVTLKENNDLTHMTVHIRNLKVTVGVSYIIPYTITLNANGGTCPISSVVRNEGTTYGAITSDSNNPSKTGYTFSHWATSDGTRIYSTTAVTGNTTLYAQYTINSYTVSKAVSPAGAGDVTGAGSGNYNTTKTLTAVENEGFEFVRWNDGVTTPTRTVTIPAQDVTYTAYFIHNKILVNSARTKGLMVNLVDSTEVFKDLTKIYG